MIFEESPRRYGRYYRHDCSVNHRTYRTLARCIWSRAVWVDGEGRYASVSYCRSEPTVLLHETLSSAEATCLWLDDLGCGRRCSRAHSVVKIMPEPGRCAGGWSVA